MPTPAYIVEEMKRQLDDPRNHRYPSNAGVHEFAEAAAGFYKRRFGVEIDPETEFFPLLGAKEGLAHICWSTLDAGDLSLVPDPGYPVYAGLVHPGGRRGQAAAACGPRTSSCPTWTPSRPDEARRAKLLFISYPNNPTVGGRRGRRRLLRARGGLRQDATTSPSSATTPTASSPTTGTWRPASSRTPGAKDVGVEFFSFSKPFNMTGWRVGLRGGQQRHPRAPLAAQDQHGLGHVRGHPAHRRRSSSTAPGTSCTRWWPSTGAAATS